MDNKTIDSEYISRKSLAKYLDCSVQKVDQLRREGVFKLYLIGTMKRFKISEVNQAISDSRI